MGAKSATDSGCGYLALTAHPQRPAAVQVIPRYTRKHLVVRRIHSAGTLARHVGPPWAVIPPALALTQPLQLFSLSCFAPRLLLAVYVGELTNPDVGGAALLAAPP